MFERNDCFNNLARVICWNIFHISSEKKELNDLIKEIMKQRLHLKSRTRKILLAVNIIISHLLHLIYILISNGLFLWKHPVTTDTLFTSFIPENLPRNLKAIFVCVYYFFSMVYTHYCSLLLCLYYCSWCLISSQEIKECGYLLAHISLNHGESRLVMSFIEYYDKIHALATLTE